MIKLTCGSVWNYEWQITNYELRIRPCGRGIIIRNDSMKNRRRKFRNGWMFVDLTITMFILTMLFVCLSITMKGMRGYNRLNLTRQQCLSAAQAQMDSIAARGNTIGDDDMGRLFEGVGVSIERKPGQGVWKGMEAVTILANKRSGKQDVNIELMRYVPKGIAE